MYLNMTQLIQVSGCTQGYLVKDSLMGLNIMKYIISDT